MKATQYLNDRLEQELKMQTLRNENIDRTTAGFQIRSGFVDFGPVKLRTTQIDPPISNYEQQLTGEVVSLRQQLKKSGFLTLLFGGVIGIHALVWLGILGVSVFKFLTR